MSHDTDPRPSGQHIRLTKHYARILMPALREVARRNGYALGLHGSLQRDIDIIAVPWREGAMPVETLMADLHAAVKAIVGWATGPAGWTDAEKFEPPPGSLPNPERKPHGRLGYAILFGGGPYLDVSVMPPMPQAGGEMQAATPKREGEGE